MTRKISRRAFSFGATTIPILGTFRSFAQPADEQDDDRVAIIDTPDDIRPWIDKLKNQKVRIVIRYLARAWQSGNPHKRIACNGPSNVCKDGHNYPGNGPSEIDQLLDHFAILSVYQYVSSDPRKFLFGLDSRGRPNSGDPSTGHVGIARAEADADADAARDQSEAIGQPPLAPIYFGLDFDFRPGADSAEDNNGNVVQYSDGTPVHNDTVVKACTAYFTRLKERFGFERLGVYGDGFASQHLLGLNLIKYSWISESRSHYRTARFLRSGPWHLFQHQVDRYWFTGQDCPSGLDLDGNIQNPDVDDIGAWNRSGCFIVDPARTRTIFARHVVAARDVPIHSQPDDSSPLIQKLRCKDRQWQPENKVDRHRSARVIADDNAWLKVDVDDDGIADGFARKAGNFVNSIKQMPDYWSDGRDQ